MAFAAPIWGYLAGQQLSNDGGSPNTKLDVSAGFTTDSTQSVGIILPAFTKTISGSWVAGSGNAGMGTGLTATASTWYHVFSAVISGAPDVFFDTSVTATHAPVGTTAFRRIGSIKLDASVHILTFTQSGNEFLWKTAALDVNNATITGGASATTETLTVPPGVNVWAFVSYSAFNNNAAHQQHAIFSPDIGNQSNASIIVASGVEIINGTSGGWVQHVRTNTSAQVLINNTSTAADQFVTIVTQGWLDTRGQDG